MVNVYVGLGTNLGDKERHINDAVQQIKERIGEQVSLSALYATAPWGFTSDNGFLNAVLCIETEFPPLEVLQITQQIERDLGRATKSVDGLYVDRVIDIDLLLYGNQVFETERLVIPHPLMTQRRFVMEPLAEIAPQLQHPLFKKNMQELLTMVSD